MHTYTIDTKAAPTKWWAKADAEARNAVNIALWNEWKQLRAEMIKTQLMLVYRARGFYVSYGKKGISVKVDHVSSIRDRQYLRALEREWKDAGLIRKLSDQGVIYRFK
jgi:hypothetical protein